MTANILGNILNTFLWPRWKGSKLKDFIMLSLVFQTIILFSEGLFYNIYYICIMRVLGGFFDTIHCFGKPLIYEVSHTEK